MLFLAIMAIAPMLGAQTADTIYPRDGKVEGYYYHTWYSDCAIYDSNYPAYEKNPDITPFTIGQNGSPGAGPFWTTAKGDTTERPIAITGIGVWQTNRADRHTTFLPGNDTMKPEYVFLFQYAVLNGRDTVLLRATARWDTAQPKTLMLPMTNDSLGTTAHSGYLSCELYEITLDTPVVVDSLFYMVGTLNNNWVHPTRWELLSPTFTQYARITDHHSAARCRFNLPISHSFILDDSTMNLSYYINGDYWGLYMARVDFADVDVQVNDTLMGAAGPSGQLSKWTTQTFVAEPKPGYAFVRWSDGINDNPRDVYITQDTTMVAIFADNRDVWSVTTRSNAEPDGRVEGGGFFRDGDTATLTAVTSDTLHTPQWIYFSHWNDGDTTNPRQFVVYQDTAFTAYFNRLAIEIQDSIVIEDSLGIDTRQKPPMFTLTPNPTTGEVTVTFGQPPLTPPEGGERMTLTIHDAAGNEVMRKELVRPGISIDLSAFPAGVYFVTLTTLTASGTQKLVVK